MQLTFRARGPMNSTLPPCGGSVSETCPPSSTGSVPPSSARVTSVSSGLAPAAPMKHGGVLEHAPTAAAAPSSERAAARRTSVTEDVALRLRPVVDEHVAVLVGLHLG